MKISWSLLGCFQEIEAMQLVRIMFELCGFQGPTGRVVKLVLLCS